MENWPRGNHGEMNVKYVNLIIPHKVQTMMLKRAQEIWSARTEDKSTERTTIEFSKKLCDRLLRRYGTGKGKSKVAFSSPSTQEQFESYLNKSDSELRSIESRIGYLLAIAKNQTQAYNECGKVRLRKDGNGFTFDIIGPNGRSTMYGGLIDHGAKEVPDWSIHT